jgi:putative addiction module component
MSLCQRQTGGTLPDKTATRMYHRAVNSALERIKEEIRALRPAERFDLWRDLGAEFDPPVADDEASVEAAWEKEIAARVKEVEEGKVELLSGEEAHRRTDAVFAELGIQRTPRRG